MICKGCGMYKISDKQSCACNAKKFKEEKIFIKKEHKVIPQISEKKKERLKDNGTEIQLFNQRYQMLKNKNKHYCVITGKILYEDELQPACFAHIANKNMFTNLRYKLNNIALVAGIDQHNILDKYISNYKKYYGLNNLIKDIESGKEVIDDIINFNT